MTVERSTEGDGLGSKHMVGRAAPASYLFEGWHLCRLKPRVPGNICWSHDNCTEPYVPEEHG